MTRRGRFESVTNGEWTEIWDMPDLARSVQTMRVFILSFFATTVIAAGVGCQNNPVAAPINDAEYERQTEQYQRQLDKGDEQIKRADRINDKVEEQGQRFDKLLNHWEEQADRYDKILDKWEAQPAPR